jgi:hypothetical protein
MQARNEGVAPKYRPRRRSRSRPRFPVVVQKQSDQAFGSRRPRSTPIPRRPESQTARSGLRNHSGTGLRCLLLAESKPPAESSVQLRRE